MAPPMGPVVVLLLLVLASAPLAHSLRAGRGANVHSSSKDGEQDAITGPIPGYQEELKTNHYGGYIQVSESKHMYYYLVLSERSPEEDPLVLWLNGGPGCSSFDGFVYEHGPFLFTPRRKDAAPGSSSSSSSASASAEDAPPVMLTSNPYAWNTVANMLFLDSPCGVGLSYSTKPEEYVTGDEQTAKDAEKFLRGFFLRHPKLQKNRFFISGESYAGIYVPNLARAVVEGNEAGHQPTINLEGYLVGNGCTDEQVDGDALPDFALGKSLISKAKYDELQDVCDGVFWNRSGDCAVLFDEVLQSLSGLNLYDILQSCYRGPNPSLSDPGGAEDSSPASLSAAAEAALLAALRREKGAVWPLVGSASKAGPTLNYAHLGLSPPCTDSRMADAWLNNPSVRQAIHAAPVSEAGRWQLCSDRITYTREIKSTVPIHRSLTMDYGLRALIYSGDHDLCVPHTGSERWTAELEFPTLTPWGPWFVADRQVAGYYVEYDGLTYATVKGAGHMVPETNPREALAMFHRYITGKSLKDGK